MRKTLRFRSQVKQDFELPAQDLEKLVQDYKACVQVELGEDFPEDPQQQLWGAIGAVFLFSYSKVYLFL